MELYTAFQWNLNRNSDIFSQENEFESALKVSAILSRPQYVVAIIILVRYEQQSITNHEKGR